MPDVFLSYSREDQATARHYAEALERDGFTVWWDQALNPGEAFDQVTEEALAAAHAVIVLWSRHSVSSRWVRAEATQANAAGRLLPVMIEECTRPIMFELTHTADLTRWKGNREDPAWQGFTASVRRFVHKRAGSHSNVPALLQPDLPRPTLQARLAPVGHALRTGAVGVGSLLRRHAGRLTFALACAAIGGAIAWALRPQPAPPAVTRFSMELPVVQGLPVPPAIALATALRPVLSPDGRRIVYAVTGSSSTQLWSRRLDQEEATPIPGSEGALSPFFSPDSQSVAFFTVPPTAQLKAFDFGGNAMRVLADVGEVVTQAGAWNDRGLIFFVKFSTGSVWRVDTTGGQPEAFASPDKGHVGIFGPSALPGADWVLLTGRNDAGSSGGFDVLAQNVATGERKVVLKGAYDARYLPTGHLVFARGGALYAIAFDVRRLAVHGREVRVVEGVANNDVGGSGAFSLAANGTLAYLSGAAFTGVINNSPTMAVARVSRTGEARQLSTELRDYYNPRVSPDGSKIALEVVGTDGSTHIWTMDAQTGIATQLTFEGEDSFPAWTADSREVLFTSRRGDGYSIWRKAADGTGEARHVVDGASDFLQSTDVHGSTLVYEDIVDGANGRDIFTFDLSGGGKPKPLLANKADDWGARISPDGRWMAYASAPEGGETAAYRVYVRPFPDAATGQRAITEAGLAWAPKWSPAGDEIYYFTPGSSGEPPGIHAASVTITPTTLTPMGRRQVLDFSRFVVRFNHQRMGSFYDVSSKDGDFVGVGLGGPAAAAAGGATAIAPAPPRLSVVENWGEELKKIVPVQ